MPGQGLIVGVGSIAFPTEFQAADPSKLAELGVSKVITVTSTYDHRIIQGAESGMFLKKVHELLLGEDDFYVDVFRSLDVPTKRSSGVATSTRSTGRPACSRSRPRSTS